MSQFRPTPITFEPGRAYTLDTSVGGHFEDARFEGVRWNGSKMVLHFTWNSRDLHCNPSYLVSDYEQEQLNIPDQERLEQELS